MKFSMVSGDVLKLECGALVVGIPAGGLTPTAEALDKASEGALAGLRPETFIPASARLQFSVIFRDAKPNALCLSA